MSAAKGRRQRIIYSSDSDDSASQSELGGTVLSDASDEELVRKRLEEMDRRAAAGEPLSQPRSDSPDSERYQVPLPPEMNDSDSQENLEDRIREAKRIHGTNMDFSLLCPTKKRKTKPKVSDWALPERQGTTLVPNVRPKRSQHAPVMVDTFASGESSDEDRPPSPIQSGAVSNEAESGNEGMDKSEDEIQSSSASGTGVSSTPFQGATRPSLNGTEIGISPVPNAADVDRVIMTTRKRPPMSKMSRIPKPPSKISNPRPTGLLPNTSTPAHLEPAVDKFTTPIQAHHNTKSGRNEAKPRTPQNKNAPQTKMPQPQPSTSTSHGLLRQQVPLDEPMESEDDERQESDEDPAESSDGGSEDEYPQTATPAPAGKKAVMFNKEAAQTAHRSVSRPSTSLDREVSKSMPALSVSKEKSRESFTSGLTKSHIQRKISQPKTPDRRSQVSPSPPRPPPRISETFVSPPPSVEPVTKKKSKSSSSQDANNILPGPSSRPTSSTSQPYASKAVDQTTAARKTTFEIPDVPPSATQRPAPASSSVDKRKSVVPSATTRGSGSAEKTGPVSDTGEYSLFSNNSAAFSQPNPTDNRRSERPGPKSVKEKRLAEKSAQLSTASVGSSYPSVFSDASDDEGTRGTTSAPNAEQVADVGNNTFPIPPVVLSAQTETSVRRKPMPRSEAEKLARSSNASTVSGASTSVVQPEEPPPNKVVERGSNAVASTSSNANSRKRSGSTVLTEQKQRISSEEKSQKGSQSFKTSPAKIANVKNKENVGEPQKKSSGGKGKLQNVKAPTGPAVEKIVPEATTNKKSRASNQRTSHASQSPSPIVVNAAEVVPRTSQPQVEQQPPVKKAARGSKQAPVNVEDGENGELSNPQRRTTRAKTRAQSIQSHSAAAVEGSAQHQVPSGSGTKSSKKTKQSEIDPRSNAEPETVIETRVDKKSSRKKGATEAQPIIPEFQPPAPEPEQGTSQVKATTGGARVGKRKAKAGSPTEPVEPTRSSKRLKKVASSALPIPMEEARDDPAVNLNPIPEEEMEQEPEAIPEQIEEMEQESEVIPNEDVAASVPVSPGPSTSNKKRRSASFKTDPQKKHLRKKIPSAVKAAAAPSPAKPSPKKNEKSRQNTRRADPELPQVEQPPMPSTSTGQGSTAVAGSSRNSEAAQAIVEVVNRSHVRRLTYSPNAQDQNASQDSDGNSSASNHPKSSARRPSLVVKKKKVSTSRRRSSSVSSRESSLIPPSQIPGPSGTRTSYFSKTSHSTASTSAPKNSKKRSKRDTTPVRYTGKDVFGNYHMMKRKQIYELLDKIQPGHGLDAAEMRKIALKTNHFLEDFFDYLCDNTNQANGFVTFKQLMALLKQQELIPKKSTPEDLMESMMSQFSKKDWKENEGVLYPSRTSNNMDTDLYFLECE